MLFDPADIGAFTRRPRYLWLPKGPKMRVNRQPKTDSAGQSWACNNQPVSATALGLDMASIPAGGPSNLELAQYSYLYIYISLPMTWLSTV